MGETQIHNSFKTFWWNNGTSFHWWIKVSYLKITSTSNIILLDFYQTGFEFVRTQRVKNKIPNILYSESFCLKINSRDFLIRKPLSSNLQKYINFNFMEDESLINIFLMFTSARSCNNFNVKYFDINKRANINGTGNPAGVS